MSVKNVSSVNSFYFKGNQVGSKENNTTQAQNNIKNGKKKLALALAALGAATVAGIAIYKGKGTKLSNITFDKGITYLNSGEKYSGTIADKLQNGDKIQLTYENGKIIKSVHKGSQNFVKEYKYVTNAHGLNDNVEIIKKDLSGNIVKTSSTKYHPGQNGKIRMNYKCSDGHEIIQAGSLLEDEGKLIKYPDSSAILVEENGEKWNISEVLEDGTIKTYNRNTRKPETLIFKDGFIANLDSEGKITGFKKQQVDGMVAIYDKEKNIRYFVEPNMLGRADINNSRKVLDKNGNLLKETVSHDGMLENRYYQNGKLYKTNIVETGYMKPITKGTLLWENGNPKIIRDGYNTETFYEDGQKQFSWIVEGNTPQLTRWDNAENGHKIRLQDGIFEDGKIKKRIWDKNGVLRYEKTETPSGNTNSRSKQVIEKYFDEKGLETSPYNGEILESLLDDLAPIPDPRLPLSTKIGL